MSSSYAGEPYERHIVYILLSHLFQHWIQIQFWNSFVLTCMHAVLCYILCSNFESMPICRTYVQELYKLFIMGVKKIWWKSAKPFSGMLTKTKPTFPVPGFLAIGVSSSKVVNIFWPHVFDLFLRISPPKQSRTGVHTICVENIIIFV